MSRARDATFPVASVLFGLMWLFAAGAKVHRPLEAYEFLAKATAPGIAVKAALVVGVTAETLLGAAMLLRTIRPVRGFAISLVFLAAAGAALLEVKAKGGAQLPCGCYGEVIVATVGDELRNNAVVAAVLIALLAWGRFGAPAKDATPTA